VSLQLHHITDLYVLIDDNLPVEKKTNIGKPAILTDSELLTILIWNSLVIRQKTLKDVLRYTTLHLSHEFPSLPKYSSFVDHCHRIMPKIYFFLERLLFDQTSLRFVDSTMLPVCKYHRANRHHTAKNIAQFGKNHQGWHYGFKLHTSIDRYGRFCSLILTPVNIHDSQVLTKILNKNTKIAVGDQGYNTTVMRRIIYRKYKTIIITPPHPKQNKKIMTTWQQGLLFLKSKIEAGFDYLKEHMHLVSSFPRSINGYILHYMRILLSYQILQIAK